MPETLQPSIRSQASRTKLLISCNGRAHKYSCAGTVRRKILSSDFACRLTHRFRPALAIPIARCAWIHRSGIRSARRHDGCASNILRCRYPLSAVWTQFAELLRLSAEVRSPHRAGRLAIGISANIADLRCLLNPIWSALELVRMIVCLVHSIHELGIEQSLSRDSAERLIDGICTHPSAHQFRLERVAFRTVSHAPCPSVRV